MARAYFVIVSLACALSTVLALSSVKKDELSYDGGGLEPEYAKAPWQIEGRTTVWKFESGKDTHLKAFLSTKVTFLGEKTGQDIIDALSQEGKCPVYLAGHVASLLSQEDSEVGWSGWVELRGACSLDSMKASLAGLGVQVLSVDGQLFVGDGADRTANDAGTRNYFTVKEAKSDVYLPAAQDTTPIDMIYYDFTRGLFIDKDGEGIASLKEKKLRVPGGESSVEDRINAWYSPERAIVFLTAPASWGSAQKGAEDAFSFEADAKSILAARIRSHVFANPKDHGKALTELAFSVLDRVVVDTAPKVEDESDDGDEKAKQTEANRERSAMLVSIRGLLQRALGHNYYGAYIRSHEPQCPGFFNIVPDGESRVRKYVPALKEVHKKISSLLQGSTHYMIFARLRTAANLHENCVQLDDKEQPDDLAGIRILVSTIRGVGKVIAKLKEGLQGSIKEFNDFVDTPRKDGYRSWDAVYTNDGKKVTVQVRSVLMTDWTEWYAELNSIHPKIMFNAHPEALDYKNKVADYLQRIDDIRERIGLDKCPDILKESVIEHPDVLASSLHDGCFKYPDMELSGLSKSMLNYFTEELDYEDGSAAVTNAVESSHHMLRSDGNAVSLDEDYVYLNLEGGQKRSQDYTPEYIDKFEFASPLIEAPLPGGVPNPYGYSYDDAVKYIEKHVSLYHLALRTVKETVGEYGRVSARLKSPGSLYANFFIKDKKIEDYHDIVGLRVTSETVSDLIEVRTRLTQRFPDAKVKYDPWTPIKEQGWYRSVHVLPKASKKYGKDFGRKENRGLEFEIQLRTPAMTAFADWSHDLVYKGDESVKSDPKVKDYVKMTSETMLDIDKERDKRVECPDVLKNIMIVNDLTSNVNTYNGCFHWHDTSAVTLDEYVPPKEVKGGWPASAIALCTALGTLSVVLAGILCFWTVMSLSVVRHRNAHPLNIGSSYEPMSPMEDKDYD